MEIIFFPSDPSDFLIDAITSLPPLWLVSLSVTTSKKRNIEMDNRVSTVIYYTYEMHQLGLFFPIVSFQMSLQIA